MGIQMFVFQQPIVQMSSCQTSGFAYVHCTTVCSTNVRLYKCPILNLSVVQLVILQLAIVQLVSWQLSVVHVCCTVVRTPSEAGRLYHLTYPKLVESCMGIVWFQSRHSACRRFIISKPIWGHINFVQGSPGTLWHEWSVTLSLQIPGPWFNIKMSSYQYRKSHCGDKTILRPSYLHNGISYTGKTTSSYWIGAQWCFLCHHIVTLAEAVADIISTHNKLETPRCIISFVATDALVYHAISIQFLLDICCPLPFSMGTMKYFSLHPPIHPCCRCCNFTTVGLIRFISSSVEFSWSINLQQHSHMPVKSFCASLSDTQILVEAVTPQLLNWFTPYLISLKWSWSIDA